jgi:hypothetical protein
MKHEPFTMEHFRAAQGVYRGWVVCYIGDQITVRPRKEQPAVFGKSCYWVPIDDDEVEGYAKGTASAPVMYVG